MQIAFRSGAVDERRAHDGGLQSRDFRERAFRLWDRQKLIARAASLGGVESLSSLPILFSHTGYSAAELQQAGVDEGMVRLSVGLEDPEDLIADLEQALA